MKRSFLFFLTSSFVSSVWANGNHGEFASMDAFEDENWSSVVGMKEGYRVFTNVPDVGLTETFRVTRANGMFVAGEKVATVREVELQVEGVSSELQNTRAALSLATTSLATLHATCTLPPTCTEPGGDKLQFNGTHWLCVCKSGYYGDSCETKCREGFYGETCQPRVCVDNCALHKSVTTSPELQYHSGHCTLRGVHESVCSNGDGVVDGNTSYVSWVNAPHGNTDCSSPLWVKIDLESVFVNVSTIVLFHVVHEDRRYCAQKVEVSSDNTSWTTVYDTGNGYGDVEQSSGKRIMFSPRSVRYIRHSCGPSNKNTGVHFLEIEVYGTAS